MAVSGGQALLNERVLASGLCVGCGACVGICPYYHYFDGKVMIMDPCRVESGRCFQVCPRAECEETDPGRGEETESSGEIGPYRRVLMARAVDPDIRDRAQYGGAVSALLIHALEAGDIDCAVLTDAGGALAPDGKIVRRKEEVLACAGSRYSASGGLSALNRAVSSDETRIGVVGLPCQMEALARLGKTDPDGAERLAAVSVRIGLFCTWALDYRKLNRFLRDRLPGKTLKKYDIPPPPAEVFRVLMDDGWVDFPLSEIRPLVQKGCGLCCDMTAHRADISVGTVEGIESWNTVIVRTDAGAALVDSAIAKGRLETEELPEENLRHLKKAAANKRERGERASGDAGRSS